MVRQTPVHFVVSISERMRLSSGHHANNHAYGSVALPLRPQIKDGVVLEYNFSADYTFMNCQFDICTVHSNFIFLHCQIHFTALPISILVSTSSYVLYISFSSVLQYKFTFLGCNSTFLEFSKTLNGQWSGIILSSV